MAARNGLIEAIPNHFYAKHTKTKRKMALRTKFSKPLCLQSENSLLMQGVFAVTTSLSPTRKLACEMDLGDCRTPKGFALRCETELKSSRSQPARFLEVFPGVLQGYK